MHELDSSTQDFLLLDNMVDSVFSESLASKKLAVRAVLDWMRVTALAFFLSLVHKPDGSTHDSLLLDNVVDGVNFESLASTE